MLYRHSAGYKTPGPFLLDIVPITGTYSVMQIIALSTLRAFWTRHPQAEGPLRGWYNFTHRARWETPTDIKRDYGANVDFVADNRVIFDLGGNKYRLIVRVGYEHKRVMIKFIGTHAEYDEINAETVGR
ncbi:MAG: hypothetical protein JWL86_2864 [Rhizobium sp.]|nr:hypothetical protein [Rhizobium sp.]